MKAISNEQTRFIHDSFNSCTWCSWDHKINQSSSPCLQRDNYISGKIFSMRNVISASWAAPAKPNLDLPCCVQSELPLHSRVWFHYLASGLQLSSLSLGMCWLAATPRLAFPQAPASDADSHMLVGHPDREKAASAIPGRSVLFTGKVTNLNDCWG